MSCYVGTSCGLLRKLNGSNSFFLGPSHVTFCSNGSNQNHRTTYRPRGGQRRNVEVMRLEGDKMKRVVGGLSGSCFWHVQTQIYFPMSKERQLCPKKHTFSILTSSLYTSEFSIEFRTASLNRSIPLFFVITTNT